MLPDLYSWNLLALRFLDVTSEIIAAAHGERGKVSEFIAILLLSAAIRRETEDHCERVRINQNENVSPGPRQEIHSFLHQPLC
jgi:hypothetical protein